MNLLKPKDFDFIARMVADKLGIRITSKGNKWCANIENKEIRYPENISLYQSDLGFLIHEASHLRFTWLDEGFYKKVIDIVHTNGKNGEQFFDLFNALEDVRINYKICEVFLGAKKYLDYTYSTNHDLICDELWRNKFLYPRKFEENWGSRKYMQFCILSGYPYSVSEEKAEIFAWDYCEYDVVDAVYKCKESLDKVQKLDTTTDLLKLIKDDILSYYLPFMDDYTKEEREKDEKDKKEIEEKMDEFKKMIEDLIDKLIEAAGSCFKPKDLKEKGGGSGSKKDGDDEKEEEKKEDEGKGEEGGEDEEDEEDGDKTDEKEKDEKSDKKGKDSDGEDNETENEEEDKRDGGATIGKDGSRKGKSGKESSVITLKRGERHKTSDEEHEEINSSSVFINKGSAGKLNFCDFDRLFYDEYSKDSGLQLSDLLEAVKDNYSKVRKSVSILKDLEFEKWESGFDSGKLEQRRIKKIFVGNGRIFMRKISLKDDNKDMAISILVDESGSMNRYGRNIEACKSVAVLAKALEAANRPFAVYGFNGNYVCHKAWNKKLNMKELLNIERNVYRDGNGDNNDGYAVKRTSLDLKKRSEKNKVIIVFSDGLPVEGYEESDEGIPYRDYDLKEEVEKAEKIGKVYGIGIQSSAVTRFYKRNKVVNNVSELGDELIKIFKENTGKRV